MFSSLYSFFQDNEFPEIIYNTNVVFDRCGTIIARYRKFNLVGPEPHESGLSTTSSPELSTFSTDFGVTFGMFTCFDMYNKSPALDLVKQKNVTDIIYPVNWVTELPFMSSPQLQLGFAYANNVNFLGSGLNSPNEGGMGSTIIAGKRRLISFWRDQAGTVLLMANVPKVSAQDQRDFTIDVNPRMYEFKKELRTKVEPYEMHYYHNNFSLYTTHVLKENDLKDKEVCNRGLCCKFSVSSSFGVKGQGSKYYR